MPNPAEFLEIFYKETMLLVGSSNVIKSNLNKNIKSELDEILSRSESAKGVLTVIITSASNHK